MKEHGKVAVIGAGYWGKNLVRNFFELGSLGAVCDNDNNKLKDIRKTYPSVHLSCDLDDIVNDENLTAVAISTPAVTHYSLAKKFLLAGKDVFVEKPLALTVEDGSDLVDTAKSKGKILMVGHLLEYHPGILKLRELIGKGELGKINYIYSNRLNLGKIRREENILWSFAPHDISVVLLFIGEMPSSVYAHGGNYLHREVADVTVSYLEFKSGVKAHIFVSWLHPYKEQKLVVVGDKKMASFDDVMPIDKLLIYDYKVNIVDGIPVSSKDVVKTIDLKLTEPLKEECRHFYECVKMRKRPRTDGLSGLRVLRVLQACEESLKTGKSVRV